MTEKPADPSTGQGSVRRGKREGAWTVPADLPREVPSGPIPEVLPFGTTQMASPFTTTGSVSENTVSIRETKARNVGYVLRSASYSWRTAIAYGSQMNPIVQ